MNRVHHAEVRRSTRWCALSSALLLGFVAFPRYVEGSTDGMWTGSATPLYVYRVFAQPGETYELETSNLSWAGADPLVVAVALGPSPVDWNAHDGEVIGVNDDRSRTDPNAKLAVSVASGPQWLKFIVMSATNGAEGRADITIRNQSTGVVLSQTQANIFGGFHLTGRTNSGRPIGLSHGTHLFAGLSTSYIQGVSDLTMHVFSEDVAACGLGTCGIYAYNDDDCNLLPYYLYASPMPPSTVDALIVVSVQGGTGTTPVTTFVSDGNFDADGDRLSQFLEEELNTCDSSAGPGVATSDGAKWVGVPGMGCPEYSAWVDDTTEFPSPPYPVLDPEVASQFWHPTDSDNDGIGDLEEVWCVERCYPSLPVPPWDDPGSCIPQSWDRCMTPCPDPSAAFTASIVLSSLPGNPDPSRYDTYLSLATPTLPTGETPYAVSTSEREELSRPYQTEGLECVACPQSGPVCDLDPNLCCTAPQDCPTDPRYFVRFHLVDEPAIVMPTDEDELLAAFATHDVRPTWPMVSGYWRTLFSHARKYTSVIRFAYRGSNLDPGSIPSQAGLVPSELGSRALYLAGTAAARLMAHEYGHTLGLLHHGGGEDFIQSRSLLYHSLMSDWTGCTKGTVIEGTDPNPTSPAPAGLYDGLGESCKAASGESCGPGLECHLTSKVCVPKLLGKAGEGKFSRGAGLPHVGGMQTYTENPNQGNTLGESGLTPHLALSAVCSLGSGTAAADFLTNHPVSCTMGTCWVDFDEDGTIDSGGDSNFYSGVSTTEFRGYNDWLA